MNHNEKMALQTVIMEELQRRSTKEPLLLIETLLGDHGRDFVLSVLTTQTGDAKRRADTLSYLTNKFMEGLREPELISEVA